MNAHVVAVVVMVVPTVVTVMMVVVVIGLGRCNSADGDGCREQGMNDFFHCVSSYSLRTQMLHDVKPLPRAALYPETAGKLVRIESPGDPGHHAFFELGRPVTPFPRCGGNATASDTPTSDPSRTASAAPIYVIENTVGVLRPDSTGCQHEQTALLQFP